MEEEIINKKENPGATLPPLARQSSSNLGVAPLSCDRDLLSCSSKGSDDTSRHGSLTTTTASSQLGRKQLTVEDVVQQVPRETEVETQVFAAVESEQDPTQGVPSSARTLTSGYSGMLRDVPTAADKLFINNNNNSSSKSIFQVGGKGGGGGGGGRAFSSPRASPASSCAWTQGEAAAGAGAKVRTTTKKSPATVEQRLDDLTDALEQIHGRHYNNNNNQAGVASLDEIAFSDDSPVMGSTDLLNKHADLLYQHRRKNTADLQSVQETMDDDDHHKAQKLWGKVRNAQLFISTGKNQEQKDDTSPASDVENGGDAAEPRPQPPLSTDPSPLLFNSQQQSSTVRRILLKIPGVRQFRAFLEANRKGVLSYIMAVTWIMIPATVMAFCLYYFADNPPTGRIDLAASKRNGTLINQGGEAVATDQPSVSWLLIFICVRQLITLSLAQGTQLLVIDFLCIGRQWTSTCLGPVTSLLIVQSRGWPFILIWWSIFNFAINYGDRKFAANWLFWQDAIGLFNAENPSGNVTSALNTFRALLIALCVGIIVSVKRTWIGFFLGRKTYVNYASDLAKVMKKIVFLSKIAHLAKIIENDYVLEALDGRRVHRTRVEKASMSHAKITSLVNTVNTDNADEGTLASCDNETTTPYVIDPNGKDKLTGALTEAQRLKITSLLGAWEEPEKNMGVEEDVSIRAILKFRQSLTFLETPFMFSYDFGLADTREGCIESAQEVYLRLVLDDPSSETLSFDVIATLAILDDGTIRHDSLKALIKLLRPDRDGHLALIDFVKSVDAVYKQARLLRAAVKNSQKIDRAFEVIFDVVFYVVMISIILSQLGFNPFSLFLSMSSIILAFAFMIGSASSKYFEGLLFILVQRPFDIGDRINIEQANSPGDIAGSASWIVKDVTLFTTTLVLGGTNEVATVSNGALASNRIINAARSPNALILDFLKFGVDVPYEKIQIFGEALAQFIKARPREWLSLLGFRPTNIQAQQGYIEYIIVVQHRSSWQDSGAVRGSQGEMQAFCLELSKKLNICFKSPPLPVNLTMDNKKNTEATEDSAPHDSLCSTGDIVQQVTSLFDKKTQ